MTRCVVTILSAMLLSASVNLVRLNAETATPATLYDLRVNALKSAENIGAVPSFSWKTRGGAPTRRQASVRVTVRERASGATVWDSHEVATDRTTGLAYGSCGGAAQALKSATRYLWTAKTKDAAGVWTAAATGEFFTGILRDADWQGASWIANSGNQGKAVSDYSATIALDVSKTVREAFWGLSSLGINEAYVNGRSVVAHNADGSTVRDRLRPGFTENSTANMKSGWTARRHSYTYDVTDLLRSGENALAARVGVAWWQDEVVASNKGKVKPAFRGVLIVRYTDGTETAFATDVANWKSALADPVTFATIYGGEEYDARKPLDWLTAALPATGWSAPVAVTWKGLTTPAPCPGIRFRDDLALTPTNLYVYSSAVGRVTNAVGTVTAHGNVVVDRRYTDGQAIALKAGETLIADFGQNCAANPKFVFSAAAGTVLTAHPAEILNGRDGLRSQFYDGPGGSAYRRNYREARSHVRYTFAGSGDETYQSAFTYYGYRILSITATGPVTIKSIRSIPVSSVLRELETGSFSCSNKKLERLERNCYWGHLSNHVSVPTTCPSRDERSAWIGDAQAFAPAACWNANALPFFTKVTRDIRDGQNKDGGFHSTRPFGDMFPGVGSGWTDGYPLITWLVYRRYGDIKILRDNWSSVTNYLAKVSPAPGAPKYDCYFGDWLANGFAVGLKGPDGAFVAHAFNMKLLRVAEKMAHALGDADAEKKYAERYAASREVFRSKYITGGRLAGGSGDNAECRYAMAFNFGAFEEDEKPNAAAAFVSYMKSQSYRVRTGYMGTVYLLDALAVGAGSPETAYSTLLNETDGGGWMHEINMGATTIWEDWRGLRANGALGVADGFSPRAFPMNSFNNNPNGTVGDFLYSGMGGIRDDASAPGYKRFRLRPFLDPRIGSCAVSFESPYGTIRSSWTCAANGDYRWTFAIPVNSTADVTRPGATRSAVYNPGTYTLTGNLAD